MSRSICNMVLTVAATSFLATALGITLHMHLAHVDSPARHDGAHCRTCQQFLASKKPYTVEFTPSKIEIDAVGQLISICPERLSFHQTSLQQCHSRAPPA